jgi:urea transport system permease protein
LIGAIIGAVAVNWAKTWLTGAAPEIWLFFLGGLFVAATLVFPRGLVGVWHQLRSRRWRAPAGVPAGEQA